MTLTSLHSWANNDPLRSFYEDPRTGEQHDLPARLLDLLRTRELYTNMDWKGYGAFQTGTFDGDLTRDLGVADVAASQRFGSDKHALMVDIDHPATLISAPYGYTLEVVLDDGAASDTKSVFRYPLPAGCAAWLIPTTTEGHNHLYVDGDWSWSFIGMILIDLVRAGVVEKGYYDASENRGKTSLRLPWVRKVVDNTPTHGMTSNVGPF